MEWRVFAGLVISFKILRTSNYFLREENNFYQDLGLGALLLFHQPNKIKSNV
jgi:hypothetical protein